MRVTVQLSVVAATALAVLSLAGTTSAQTAEQARDAEPFLARAACTPAETKRRQAALAAYRKRMAKDRAAFFRSHKSAKQRKAFVKRQHAKLKTLQRAAAACRASPKPPSAPPPLPPQPPPPPPPPPAPAPVLPATGSVVPGMASFDRVIPELMKAWGIPGGAVAVVRDGRLVFARGYGYADVGSGQLVAPDALFRIASVSKPITAAAILKLVEEGRLSLDAKPYPMRPDLTPPPGTTAVDPRIYDVTVRQLLWHTAGWDRDRPGGFDPMFRSTLAAQAVGLTAPAGPETVMRYMLGFPLDFTPGTRFAYSNFGYAVLGRVIEKASGEPYEQYVKRAVLAPAGITRMQLGRTLETERLPGEVRYYDPATATSVFPGGGTAPFPYGGFYLEAMDAHGGWVASTVDLLRFVTAVDGLPSRSDVLSPASIHTMIARPPAIWDGFAWHYGMGWGVRPDQGNWSHSGSLPGTASILVRTGRGLAWAAIFNARRMSPDSAFQSQIDGKLSEAVLGVTAWPSHDLFSQFP